MQIDSCIIRYLLFLHKQACVFIVSKQITCLFLSPFPILACNKEEPTNVIIPQN